MSIADKLTLLADTKEALRVKLGLGVDVPFSDYYKLAIRKPFEPTDLFVGGKQGVWYDPSDKSTLFQDVAGTVPVTKDGDPVGLILDKSQGVTGKTVLDMTDIDFNDGTWHSSSHATGNRLSNLAGGVPYAKYDLRGLVDRSKNYKVVIRLKVNEVGGASNVFKAVLGELNASVEYLNTSISIDTSEVVAHITGGGLEFFNIRLYMLDVDILNIEITELLGNHAKQTLSAARPLSQTDGTKSWLYNDKVDDKVLVMLPAMTATVVEATDEGVSIDYPVSITAGDTVITSTSVLGHDFGRLIINKELSVSEITQVTSYFNAKRGT